MTADCGGSGQLPQYPVIGVNFGAAVEGAKTEVVRGQTNAQYFARRWLTVGLGVAAARYQDQEADRRERTSTWGHVW